MFWVITKLGNMVQQVKIWGLAFVMPQSKISSASFQNQEGLNIVYHSIPSQANRYKLSLAILNDH
jgi:hypothetical protein